MITIQERRTSGRPVRPFSRCPAVLRSNVSNDPAVPSQASESKENPPEATCAVRTVLALLASHRYFAGSEPDGLRILQVTGALENSHGGKKRYQTRGTHCLSFIQNKEDMQCL